MYPYADDVAMITLVAFYLFGEIHIHNDTNGPISHTVILPLLVSVCVKYYVHAYHVRRWISWTCSYL